MAVRVDHPAGRITCLLIDRPDKRNAIDADTRAALVAAVSAACADPACGAIVLGGTGHIFSAGGDLPSMIGQTEAEARARLRDGHHLCRLIAEAPMPVVSAAEGICAGAAIGLAMLGDHIVVDSRTQFLFPFLSLGLVPDWGLIQSMALRLGGGRARHIFLNGRPVSGREAERIGLADELVEDGRVMDAAIERAIRLSELSPDAFARMKLRLQAPSSDLQEELAREEVDQVALFLGPDLVEGFAAFSEKRQPRFAERRGTAA